jgi:hypothetical protein
MSAPVRSLARLLFWTLAIACLLLLVGYVFRAPLLTGLADAWVVNDPVTKPMPSSFRVAASKTGRLRPPNCSTKELHRKFFT